MTTTKSQTPGPRISEGGGKRRSMRIGVMCGRLQGFEDGHPEEALVWASSGGYDGVLFATPRAMSPELDGVALKEAGELAAERGLYLEVGIGSLGPFGDAGERLAELNAHIDAAATAGCREFFAYTRTDRHHASVPHAVQLAAVQKTLETLAPRLRDEGLRLNLKTHEDLSSHEVLRLVDESGTDVVGVSLDVANLVVRGEDPVEATRRLAPHVHQTHFEDVALYIVERGLRRRLRPCGAGVLDWAAILRTLAEESPARRLTLEQHAGRFDLDVFDPAWFDAEPHVTARELAVLFRHAVDCERRASAGELPSLAAYDDDGGHLARRGELAESARWLRHTLDTIGRSSWQ
ncbi:sugar phosphate isomerase/epimerase [Sinomonas sp. ASV322]|uniref:sugar phosphate isomerase/epimerase family protein n=1 Tax=Sinomonas sp. ASV322 TaxID=3041920 RepID=UPI0027DB2240|nr:sugar phosphate isomerase/epimerase [Sinomonas sp. ASV322]MDQ4501492.1 sugar phosphate isomerase/epimerase [Sinomonas sp. ASV322]